MEDLTDNLDELRKLITIYETIGPPELIIKNVEELKKLTGIYEEIGLSELLIKAYEQFINGYNDDMDDATACDELVYIYKEMKKGYNSNKSMLWWRNLYYKCKSTEQKIATKTTTQELKQEETEAKHVIIKQCLLVLWMKIMPLTLD